MIFFICLHNTSYQDNILQDESYSASSTQNEGNPVLISERNYIIDQEFLNWIEDQKKIQMNIQSVCDKYGKLGNGILQIEKSRKSKIVQKIENFFLFFFYLKSNLVHKIPVQSSDILYDEKSKFLMCGNSKVSNIHTRHDICF